MIFDKRQTFYFYAQNRVSCVPIRLFNIFLSDLDFIILRFCLDYILLNSFNLEPQVFQRLLTNSIFICKENFTNNISHFYQSNVIEKRSFNDTKSQYITKHIINVNFRVLSKLYIPSNINIWRKVLTKSIWADKKWADFCSSSSKTALLNKIGSRF